MKINPVSFNKAERPCLFRQEWHFAVSQTAEAR